MADIQPEQDNMDICVICYEDINDPPGDPHALDCHHQFHRECINQWLASGVGNGCPCCRHGHARPDSQILPTVILPILPILPQTIPPTIALPPLATPALLFASRSHPGTIPPSAPFHSWLYQINRFINPMFSLLDDVATSATLPNIYTTFFPLPLRLQFTWVIMTPAGEVRGEAAVTCQHLRLHAVQQTSDDQPRMRRAILSGLIEGVERRMSVQLSGIYLSSEVYLSSIRFKVQFQYPRGIYLDGSAYWDSASTFGSGPSMRFHLRTSDNPAPTLAEIRRTAAQEVDLPTAETLQHDTLRPSELFANRGGNSTPSPSLPSWMEQIERYLTPLFETLEADWQPSIHNFQQDWLASEPPSSPTSDSSSAGR